jgi:hypothetical protein
MADDQPAGMFDTTHTMPVPQESTGTTLVAGAAPQASLEAATGTTPVPVDAGAAATPSSAAIAIEALKAGKGSKPGGLPSQAKKGADSSRDAAAEALKRFFDNR